MLLYDQRGIPRESACPLGVALNNSVACHSGGIWGFPQTHSHSDTNLIYKIMVLVSPLSTELIDAYWERVLTHTMSRFWRPYTILALENIWLILWNTVPLTEEGMRCLITRIWLPKPGPASTTFHLLIFRRTWDCATKTQRKSCLEGRDRRWALREKISAVLDNFTTVSIFVRIVSAIVGTVTERGEWNAAVIFTFKFLPANDARSQWVLQEELSQGSLPTIIPTARNSLSCFQQQLMKSGWLSYLRKDRNTNDITYLFFAILTTNTQKRLRYLLRHSIARKDWEQSRRKRT